MLYVLQTDLFVIMHYWWLYAHKLINRLYRFKPVSVNTGRVDGCAVSTSLVDGPC